MKKALPGQKYLFERSFDGQTSVFNVEDCCLTVKRFKERRFELLPFVRVNQGTEVQIVISGGVTLFGETRS